MSRKKRLECYLQEQFNLHREYSVFVSPQCIVNNGKLKMRRRRERQQLCTCITLFCTFLCPSTPRLPVKMPNFMFCEGRKQAMTKFILFMNLDMVDRNSAPEEFACILQRKRIGIITIETEKM